MTATLRPYLVIAAVDGKVGPMGGVDYLRAPALRATVKVKDAAGRVECAFVRRRTQCRPP